jgi:hypothetical protein
MRFLLPLPGLSSCHQHVSQFIALRDVRKPEWFCGFRRMCFESNRVVVFVESGEEPPGFLTDLRQTWFCSSAVTSADERNKIQQQKC